MCPIKSQSFKAYLHICQDMGLRRRPRNTALNFPPQTSQVPPKQNFSQQPQCARKVSDFTKKSWKKTQTDNPTAVIFIRAYRQPSFLAALRLGGAGVSPRAVPGEGSPPFPQDNVICFLCRRAFAKSRLSHA